MLEELRGEDTAERSVVERLEGGDRIRLLDVEALSACVRDHVGVGVDSARVDARLPKQGEELSAPAAEVEHGRRVPEILDIRALAVADLARVTAHPRLEREVVVDR